MADRGPSLASLCAITVLAAVSAAGAHLTTTAAHPERRALVTVTQSHMGMPVRLRVYAPDDRTARRACAAAFERIARLNMVLSDYESGSELSHLARRSGLGPVAVSEELYRVLAAALDLARHSGGLLDPTAAPATRLWRGVRAERRLPDPRAVEAVLGRVGHEHVVLNEGARSVDLRRRNMQLDLGAIAKGYVGDQALRVLREHGVTRAMFEAGGDMVFGDPPPGEEGWLVRPEDPALPELRLANCAAAISGNSVQFVEIEGQRYGHLIDPRTGQPVRTSRACLVTAPDGLTADPLATLGTMMPGREFRTFIARHFPDAEAWVTTSSAQSGKVKRDRP